jgi:hypothetical protein
MSIGFGSICFEAMCIVGVSVWRLRGQKFIFGYDLSVIFYFIWLTPKLMMCLFWCAEMEFFEVKVKKTKVFCSMLFTVPSTGGFKESSLVFKLL